MQDNNSLVLDVLKEKDTLKMSIFEQGELASTIRHYSALSVSFDEIRKLCQEIIVILNKADKHGLLETDTLLALKKTGQLLWDQLLTGQVKNKLKSAQIANLVLTIDEELIALPWELLYTGEEFLCLKFNLGRLLRTRKQQTQVQYRGHISSDALKMLILANPTNDLKSAYLEGINIRNQFDQKRKEIKIDFKSTNIDTFYLKKNLRDYDIVHFAGHCEYSKDSPYDSGWVLSDGRFTTRDILALAESLSLPSLVFSNVCDSARVAPDLIDNHYQEKAYSLAAAFLFSGVKHYIGAIRKIEDDVSLIFAKEFYAQLIRGESLGECVRMSRLRLTKEYGAASVCWANYLLYGDPNFVLFKQMAGRPKKTARIRIRPTRKLIVKFLLLIAVVLLFLYLNILLPTTNPNAYISFLKSRRLFSSGRNQEAIAAFRGILKQDPYFLAVYPQLAATYQRLGRSEEALKTYFDYAVSAQKRKDNKHLASAYAGIGWLYQLSGEYPKAFEFYDKSLNLSRASGDALNEAIALRMLAVWYIDKEDYPRALELLTRSSEINRQREAIYEHRYNLACDYFDIGLVFSNRDDFSSAKEFYQKSRIIFQKLKLKNELSDYYFNLGEIHLFEKQYQNALDCYLKGLKIDEAIGNLPSIASDNNMIGELYVEMGNLEEAQKHFNQSVLIGKNINAPLELACAYYNLGLLYKQKIKINKARDYLRKAQEIYYKIDTSDYQKIKQELLSLN